MAHPIALVVILDEKRAGFARRVGTAFTARRDFRQAPIVLLRSQGLSQRQVLDQVAECAVYVSLWSGRYSVGLHDRPRRGPWRSIPPATVEKLTTRAG